MQLKLATTAEALSALDRIERARAVRTTSGWSPGRALAHCAQSVECSLAGYPLARSALFRATAGRLALAAFLRKGAMSHDLQAAIPGAPELGEVSLAEGLARLRAALAAFAAHSGEPAPHFAYGPVSKARYEAVHAMHLADHLGAFELDE